MSRRPSVLACFATLALALTACDAFHPRNPPINANPANPTVAPHEKRTSLPPATDEGAGPDGSLLHSYAQRTSRAVEDQDTWMLPFQAKTMIVELLIAAGKDDVERMSLLLADNARWGLPDRRELRARPISTPEDPHGIEFLTAFRAAAARFGEKSSFSCAPLQPGWQTFAASGAEPVWCSYTSTDNLDIIGFRLIVVGGRVKTDYIGFFPDRQRTAIRVPDAGDPPPLTPLPKRPVDLVLPELMPNGSNPVVEAPRPGASKPARPATEPDVDAPIPVSP